MKKIVLALVAAACAVGVFADGYQDWFTPKNGFSQEYAYMDITVGTQAEGYQGFPLDMSMYEIQLYIEGLASSVPSTAKNAFEISKSAFAQSVYAIIQARKNEVKIDNIAASIEGIFGAVYGQYQDKSGNVISKSNTSGEQMSNARKLLVANKNSVLGGSKPTGGSESNPFVVTVTQQPYDEKEFEQRITADSKSLVALKGYKDLQEMTEVIAAQNDKAIGNFMGWLPIVGGKDYNLQWKAWGGIDELSLETIQANGNHKGEIGIKGFQTGSAGTCENTLSETMTDNRPNEQTARSTHKILTRYSSGSGDPELHWMSLGDSMGSSADIAPDDVSITTVIQEDNTTNICIYGVNDANDEAGASETECGFIPYVDGGETLAWAGFSEFFNSNVFKTDANGKIVLNGIDDAGANDIMVVTAKGDGEEQTVDVVKLDGDEFEKTSDGELKLDGYDSPAETCELSLDEMLTSDTDLENTRKHYFLSKYEGTGGQDVSGLHWVSIDNTLDKNILPDDASITTNTTNGAFEDGKLSIYGIATANDSAAEDEVPYIPYVDGAEDAIGWAGITDFFSEKVFDKTSDGKIILNGVSEEGSDKVRILSVSGYGDDQEVGTIAFDNASVDGNIETAQTIQMHNFSVAPNPYQGGNNFADALTNTATTIAGMSVPVRYNSGTKFEIGYIPMGKVTGIPAAAVDDKTIEVNEADPNNKFLQLHGAAGEGITLEDGQVYAIKNGKGKFVNITGINAGQWAHPSLEETEDENGNICLSLYNWNNTIEGSGGLLGWNSEHELSYWEADSFGGLSIRDDSALTIDGYFDASANAIPYKKQSSGNEDGIGWINLPENRVIIGASGSNPPTGAALGLSLDKQNVSAVPTINVAGFMAGGNCDTTIGAMLTTDSGNRAKHQVMTRYSDGSNPSVHWVSIGEVAGGGAPVDEHSITTNTSHGAITQGDASIYGFASATAGTVPHKKNDGTIEWKAAGGGSITVKGDYDSTEVLTTNKIEFTGHQLKFKVTEENGKTKVDAYPIVGNFAYNPIAHTINAGYTMIARKCGYVGGITVSSSGYVCLCFTYNSAATFGWVVTMVQGLSSIPDTTDTVTYIPLYYINASLEVAADYRGMPHLQIWE